jgi:hypothetical protein
MNARPVHKALAGRDRARLRRERCCRGISLIWAVLAHHETPACFTTTGIGGTRPLCTQSTAVGDSHSFTSVPVEIISTVTAIRG